MRHVDIFSGIGGWPLGFSWAFGADHEPVAFCEMDKFCQSVLKKHWPAVPIIENVFDMKGSDFDAIDVLSCSPPCQPYSVAGKQKGTGDDRALWPQVLRVIREMPQAPTWVCVENVYGLINIESGLAFEHLLSDLEDTGYQVQPFIIPAAGVGAPHRRDRVWIVAFSDSGRIAQSGIQQSGLSSKPGDVAHTDGRRGRSSDRNPVNEKRRAGKGRRAGVPTTTGRPEGTAIGDAGATGEDVPNPKSNGRRSRRAEPEGQQGQAGTVDGGAVMANTADAIRRSRQYGHSSVGAERHNQPSRSGGEPAALASLGDSLDGLPPGMAGWLDGTWEDGIPRVTTGEKDRAKKLKALGNAILPQLAEAIAKSIIATEGK